MLIGLWETFINKWETLGDLQQNTAKSDGPQSRHIFEERSSSVGNILGKIPNPQHFPLGSSATRFFSKSFPTEKQKSMASLITTMGLGIHTWIALVSVLSLGLASKFSSQTVKINGPATLNCSENCTDGAAWKKGEHQVICSSKSCKEGFQLSPGNALSITAVDYSKTGFYTFVCGTEIICDVNLILESLQPPLQKRAGETLSLDLLTDNPVNVTFKSSITVNTAEVWICTVTGRLHQCNPEYEGRVSVTDNSLLLKGALPSDTGNFTVQDLRKNEKTFIYSVSVQEAQENWFDRPSILSNWHVFAAIVMTVVFTVCIVHYGPLCVCYLTRKLRNWMGRSMSELPVEKCEMKLI